MGRKKRFQFNIRLFETYDRQPCRIRLNENAAGRRSLPYFDFAAQQLTLHGFGIGAGSCYPNDLILEDILTGKHAIHASYKQR